MPKKRELERRRLAVLERKAQGQTTAQIAEALGVSARTVTYDLAHISSMIAEKVAQAQDSFRYFVTRATIELARRDLADIDTPTLAYLVDRLLHRPLMIVQDTEAGARLLNEELLQKVKRQHERDSRNHYERRPPGDASPGKWDEWVDQHPGRPQDAGGHDRPAKTDHDDSRGTRGSGVGGGRAGSQRSGDASGGSGEDPQG